MVRLDNKTIMNLSPWDFDQSPNGWRKYEASGEYIKAAELIGAYIAKNKDRVLYPLKEEKAIYMEIMYFHIGQLLAFSGAGRYQKAIDAFKLSFRSGNECWNAYVSATIGFLENDMQKIEEAIKAIELSREKDKGSGNINIVKNFKKALENKGLDYREVYLWPRN